MDLRFPYSPAEVAKVRTVQFGILSPDEIVIILITSFLYISTAHCKVILYSFYKSVLFVIRTLDFSTLKLL